LKLPSDTVALTVIPTMKIFVAALLFCIGSAAAFAPAIHQSRVPTALAATNPSEALHKLGASFIATATIMSNVMFLPQEVNAFDAGSSQVIAARSGGRAGGRAPARAAPSKSQPRVIERQTTIIQQQPSYASPGGTMMMAPPMMAAPMYAPQPSGLGLALGINAVSGISSGFREARQENEIRSTRDQLTEARIKEAEMEARLRSLEQQQQYARQQ
jgi:hypothetical protein